VKKTKQVLLSEIVQVLNNAKKAECYLFLGKAYDNVLNEALATVPHTISHLIGTCSVNDKNFNFDGFIDYCTDKRHEYIDGLLTILCLENRLAEYQARLLVPLERLTISLLVFADSDSITETFASRVKCIFKQTNENLRVSKFIQPDKLPPNPPADSLYACPSFIKLGDYNRRSPADKKMDDLISELNSGSVYPEILSGLQPPIKTFGYDVQLEAMSLLKKRLDS
jgi:hypothetical protein